MLKTTFGQIDEAKLFFDAIQRYNEIIDTMERRIGLGKEKAQELNTTIATQLLVLEHLLVHRVPDDRKVAIYGAIRIILGQSIRGHTQLFMRHAVETGGATESDSAENVA